MKNLKLTKEEIDKVSKYLYKNYQKEVLRFKKYKDL